MRRKREALRFHGTCYGQRRFLGGCLPVLLVFRPLLLLSLLLLGTNVTAQEPSRGRELVQRRVTLSQSATGKPVELHVASGSLTALEFDSPVDRAGVKLGDAKDRFELIVATDRLIMLKPTGDMGTGERVLLTVPFADGMAPARAVFALVTNATQVDAQVQVSRLPRTAEAVQAELDEVRAACAGKNIELEALRARSAATGPSGMLLAGMLDIDGFQAKELTDLPPSPTDGLKAERVKAFRGTGWVALSLEITNEGAVAWTPLEARLSPVGGGRSRAATVAMKEPRIAPGGKALVVVEARGEDWPEGSDRRVELRDSTGARRLLIPYLVF
ncbi:DUF2381 family protein [Corallococcus exercitus]|uniref:DUF2381 family protein n=1 Tax=Corallococcus exercitus TaxID=2316736 RepID=A0A7Y4KGY9_9BACT|nr:DUF2381 family protein [Corallococcus exercitus]